MTFHDEEMHSSQKISLPLADNHFTSIGHYHDLFCENKKVGALEIALQIVRQPLKFRLIQW